LVGHAHPTLGEEVVVRRCDDGGVEVCCHGGQAAVARIESLLEKVGCQIVRWQSWAVGAKNDSTAIAILEALAQARTERTAAILLDQYHGALDQAMDAIRRAADYGDVDSAKRQVDDLLARASLGRHLVRPWRVVLGGPVNVGKSSLGNALVGYGRSIVHDMPGTTRDAVTVTTAIDGWPVELCDTAGLHAGGDAVEVAGIQLAQQRIAEADLVLLVFDYSSPWPKDHQTLWNQWPQALVVFNKCDLPPASGERPPGCVVSAKEGQGIDDLLAAISRRLVPKPPPPGAALPLDERQIEAIRRLAAVLG
jgi:tRNA modification GTPase